MPRATCNPRQLSCLTPGGTPRRAEADDTDGSRPIGPIGLAHTSAIWLPPSPARVQPASECMEGTSRSETSRRRGSRSKLAVTLADRQIQVYRHCRRWLGGLQRGQRGCPLSTVLRFRSHCTQPEHGSQQSTEVTSLRTNQGPWPERPVWPEMLNNRRDLRSAYALA